ncbi:cryptochrome/photolyase family protein [Marinomonas agarivorans]|nr:cryptochrome/photolyase family protein [Marinomonas agarivorans]
MSNLCFILGDQLSFSLSSLQHINPTQDVILMCEVWDEATYVKHHKKKIAFLFTAMRHFAASLREKGYQVIYIRLDDPENTGSFQGEVQRLLQTGHYNRLIVTQPGEYRVLADMQQWQSLFNLPVDILPDTRFLCSIEEFQQWAQGRKQLRMEYFYREMRKKYRILMQNDEPIGGQWNYDAENRKPPRKGLNIPAPYSRSNEAQQKSQHSSQPIAQPIAQQAMASQTILQDVLALVAKRFSDHFGDLEPFYFAVTRSEALEVLAQFIQQRLPYFGDYQDAMLQGEPWMYHSHISFYLNCGLLEPLECIHAAEQAYFSGTASLNAVEGFVRQILGWREYVRGIYWLTMPTYKEANFFEATRPLPSFYWHAKTDMNCLHQCISETQRHAYAHHIQRLMVLGNFALLAGIAPHEVNEWFLIVYADAYEWVELPNVSGMILFADGGYLASKPYAAGGSYINKMSDYCKQCRYKVTVKNGPDACPFNYLYWDFLARNRAKLQSNHRLGMMYKTLDRMSDEKRRAIQQDSQIFLNQLDA